MTKKQPTLPVEVLRAWDDYTWDTEIIEIPFNTPAEDLARLGCAEAERQVADDADPSLVGTMLYAVLGEVFPDGETEDEEAGEAG